MHKRIIIGLLVIGCLGWFSSNMMGKAFAADYLKKIELSSSFNPLGSGARALGMGGAFIAVADDATAASWNPGGLIQLERPEISVVGAGFYREEENHFRTSSTAGDTESVYQTETNYLSVTCPFEVFGFSMVGSINYQKLYDFTRKWTFPIDLTWTMDDPPFTINQTNHVNYRLDGGLSAIGFAWCMQLTYDISFGATLNIWDDGLTENSWEKKVYQSGDGTFNGYDGEFYSMSRDSYTFEGVNANVGLLWNVNGHLSLGAVVKTPFTADLTHDRYSYAQLEYDDGVGGYAEESFSEDASLDMPLSYGVGAAYRFSDALTLSLDVYRTHWEDYILSDQDGDVSPVTGKSEAESDIDPTVQVRMGGEYLMIMPRFLVPVRGGLFYDPAPAQGRPDNIWGLSLGSGIGWDRMVWDIAYQYRFGNDIGKSVLQDYDFSQDIREHTLYSSVIVYF